MIIPILNHISQGEIGIDQRITVIPMIIISDHDLISPLLGKQLQGAVSIIGIIPHIAVIFHGSAITADILRSLLLISVPSGISHGTSEIAAESTYIPFAGGLGTGGALGIFHGILANALGILTDAALRVYGIFGAPASTLIPCSKGEQ